MDSNGKIDDDLNWALTNSLGDFAATVHLFDDGAAAWFAPLAWIMGVSWKDAADIGNLLGTRLVLNEFVAFTQLGPMKGHLDPRSFTIATYALCGFATFRSIAIQIGGIGALAPNRKSDLARMGIRAVAAGAMANFMSACIAGMLW